MANLAVPQTTLQDLQSLSINQLVPASGPLGSHKISELLQPALAAAQAAPDEPRVSALRVIDSVCSFYFNPADKGEPYGPMARFGNERTYIPTDFTSETIAALGAFADELDNLALRARVSDVAWLLNPKSHTSAILAINSFCDCVEEIVRRNAEGDTDEIHERRWSCPNLLRRAFDIGRRVGWDRPEVHRAKALLQQLRVSAHETGDEGVFRLCAELDLQQGISDPAEIGRLARDHSIKQEAAGNFLAAQTYLRLAENAFSEAKLEEEAAKCLVDLSECCYRESSGGAGSTFAKTHSLTQAIQALRQAPRKYRPAQRLQELQSELVQAQASIGDEMGTFEFTQDLSELINNVKAELFDKKLSECILMLAKIDLHRPYSYYLEQARKQAEETPLASLFAASVHDDEGKVVASTSAPSNDESDENALRVSIARSLSLGYGLIVSGGIEPTRFFISQQYHVSNELMLRLCQASPFVPDGHVAIYALGLSRFFAGAHMEAASLLVPQLENSLRYVLKQSGTDVSTMLPNMSQEDVGFSILLGRLKPKLEAIFGEEVVFKIEMLFHDRLGTNLRNRLSHGTLTTGHFWTAETIYGCWFIFQLVCAPLLQNWDSVSQTVFVE